MSTKIVKATKKNINEAVAGAIEIGPPVMSTILTTTAVCLLIYFISGVTGNIFANIPNVLIVVF